MALLVYEPTIYSPDPDTKVLSLLLLCQGDWYLRNITPSLMISWRYNSCYLIRMIAQKGLVPGWAHFRQISPKLITLGILT